LFFFLVLYVFVIVFHQLYAYLLIQLSTRREEIKELKRQLAAAKFQLIETGNEVIQFFYRYLLVVNRHLFYLDLLLQIYMNRRHCVPNPRERIRSGRLRDGFVLIIVLSCLSTDSKYTQIQKLILCPSFTRLPSKVIHRKNL